jgi:hypothetical protein
MLYCYCKTAPCKRPLGRAVDSPAVRVMRRVGVSAFLAMTDDERVEAVREKLRAVGGDWNEGNDGNETVLVTDREAITEDERRPSRNHAMQGRHRIVQLGGQVGHDVFIPLPALVRCRRLGHVNEIARRDDGTWYTGKAKGEGPTRPDDRDDQMTEMTALALLVSLGLDRVDDAG